MTIRIRDLTALPLREEDAFRRAGIELLPMARAVLTANRTRAAIIPGGIGLARLVNLVGWRVDEHLEYLDEEAVCADQLVHFAAHQVMAAVLDSKHGHALLMGECFASALDLYLLGKLIRAGEETGFLVETIESFGSYFELYGSGPTQLEHLLTSIGEDPFATMARGADYLFRCGRALLDNPDPAAMAGELVQLAQDPMYPLIHHYNIANWVVTIKGECPGPEAPLPALARVHELFFHDEQSLLCHFKLPPAAP